MSKVNGEECINMLLYSRMYCEIDCEVLRKGYDTFRSWILDMGKNSPTPVHIDIDIVISIASFSHKYMISQGCYENGGGLIF